MTNKRSFRWQNCFNGPFSFDGENIVDKYGTPVVHEVCVLESIKWAKAKTVSRQLKAWAGMAEVIVAALNKEWENNNDNEHSTK